MKATASQTTAKASAAGQNRPIRQPRKVATPLPPLKPSQTGKRCPRKAPQAATSAAGGAELGADENRHRSLEHVAEEGRGRQALLARAQHIGRADIAGADAAQIRAAGEARQDDAEGNGAQKIGDDEGRDQPDPGRRRIARTRHFAPPHRSAPAICAKITPTMP